MKCINTPYFLLMAIGLIMSSELYAAPANDDCSGATLLTVNTTCTTTNGTTVGASQSMPAINCNGWTGNADDDVWYKFVAGNTSQTITVTGNGSFDAVLELLSGSCGSLSSVTCSDNTYGGGTETIAATGLTVGNTYYIRVYDWYNGNNGTFTICVYGTPAGNPGDDCANAIAIACGDTLTGQTTFGNSNTGSSWNCHIDENNIIIPTPGEDRFYQVNVTDPTTTTVRVYLLNVVDTNTWVEVIFTGSTCATSTCTQSAQWVDASNQFQGGLSYHDFSVPGAGTYYLIIDSQGPSSGVQSYDISISCIASGIQFDTNGCGDDVDSNAYTAKWNGGALSTIFPGDTGTLCYTVYIKNPSGWEWLKYVDMYLGSCWTNIGNMTPKNPPGSNGFYDTNGDWSVSYNGAGNEINWSFVNSVNGPWGDDNINNYYCHAYTFCFDTRVLSTCSDSTNLQIIVRVTDDGIGGSGNTLPSNYSIVSTFVLPVELLTFSGNAEPDGNHLHWATATEENSDHFVIERSIDGEKFYPIAYQKAAGQSSARIDYRYIDQSPMPGKNYYRLKQFDFNGSYGYSDIIEVETQIGQSIMLTGFYPNPVSDYGSLSVISSENQVMKAMIMDVAGRQIASRLFDVFVGENTIAIDFSSFADGIYNIILLNSADERAGTIKVVK